MEAADRWISSAIEPPPDPPILALAGGRITDYASFVEEANRSICPRYEEWFGEPWSGNLDAFDDILHGAMGTPEGGFVLRFQDTAAIRKGLGYRETVRWLEEMLENCHPTNRKSVAARLELARRHEGETLFDVVVRIIREHGPAGLDRDHRVLLELDD